MSSVHVASSPDLLSAFERLCSSAVSLLCYGSDQVLVLSEEEASEEEGSLTEDEVAFALSIVDSLTATSAHSLAGGSGPLFIVGFTTQVSLDRQLGRLVAHCLEAGSSSLARDTITALLSSGAVERLAISDADDLVARILARCIDRADELGSVPSHLARRLAATPRAAKWLRADGSVDVERLGRTVRLATETTREERVAWQARRERVESAARSAHAEWLRTARSALGRHTDTFLHTRAAALRSAHDKERDRQLDERRTMTTWQQALEQNALDRLVWHGHLDKTGLSESAAELRRWLAGKDVDEDTATVRWRLDPTEGPNRCRARLQRIPAAQSRFYVPQKMIMSEAFMARLEGVDHSDCSASINDSLDDETEGEDGEREGREGEMDDPAAAAAAAAAVDEAAAAAAAGAGSTSVIVPGDIVRSARPATLISHTEQRTGELLIGETHCYFLGEREDTEPLVLNLAEVRRVHRLRHLLRDTAFELFLAGGLTFVFECGDVAHRDATIADLTAAAPSIQADSGQELSTLTKRWCRGDLSNFAYLMALNTLAGRSFNDLAQYPVFPHVLGDAAYEANVLVSFVDAPALVRSRWLRDLSKPMGAQDDVRLNRFKERRQQLREMGETPYLYGSHYSNPGSVLYYLIRLEPFSSYTLDFQGGKFDVPDRLFNSVAGAWRLSSSSSASDVKELVPEFFFLPDFLANHNRLDFGLKQSGERVSHVQLPPWAHGSTREFVRLHREVLESPAVTDMLPAWIDLIFGYKQSGAAAERADNIFHPLTYEGSVDVDSIEDEVMRRATISQISSFGQQPRRLFAKAHPSRTAKSLRRSCVTDTAGIAGSPHTAALSAVGSLALVTEGRAVPVARGRTLLQSGRHVVWSAADRRVRVLADPSTGSAGTVLAVSEYSEWLERDCTCSEAAADAPFFVTGHTDGTLTVFSYRDETVLRTLAVMTGHAKRVTTLAISSAWSLLASGGADGHVALFDLNRYEFVRRMRATEDGEQVEHLAINEATADVAASHSGGTAVTLWSTNGEAVGSASFPLSAHVTSLAFAVHDGASRHLLAVGLSSGCVELRDSWKPSIVVRTLRGLHSSPVSAITVTPDAERIYTGDESGLVVLWTTKAQSRLMLAL
jgi:hypothetical protein